MVVENGVVTDYVFPLAQQTMAFNLNNKGVVVGQWQLANGHQGAWKSEGGVMTDISYPGAAISYATGINDRGVIVGIRHDDVNSRNQGWILDEGVYTSIGVPSTPERGAVTDTNLDVILNDGTMSGIYGTSDGIRHGFVMTRAGRVTTFDAPVPGVRATVVRGLNDKGDLVGRYVRPSDGKEVGFVWYGAAR